MDWIEVVRKKNIHPEDEIVVYGYTKEDTDAIARRFQQSGFGNIRPYDHFINEWVSNSSLSMERLERGKQFTTL